MKKSKLMLLVLFMVVVVGFSGYCIANESQGTIVWKESFANFSPDVAGWQVTNLAGRQGLQYEADGVVNITLAFPQVDHGRLEFSVYQEEGYSSNFGIKPYPTGDSDYINFWISKAGEARLWRGADSENPNDIYPTGYWHDFAFEWDKSNSTFVILAKVNNEWVEKWSTDITTVPSGLYLDGAAEGLGAISNLILRDLDKVVPAYLNPELPPELRAADLVSRMTLSEKISQMGHNAPAIMRLGVSGYGYWNEALHGVARSGLATSFPQAIALASTWDTDLMYEVASAISDEARVYYNLKGKGLSYWSPTINVSRDPRWGRAEEAYSEDPFLTAQFGISFVKGMQGENPDYLKTIATIKHFAANNSEYNRRHGSSDMDERTLREYYLPAFKATVEEANPFSLMTAYNAINGIPASAHKELVTDILRDQWGFSGYVVSDYGAISDVYSRHHYVATAPEAAAVCIKAGTDLNAGNIYQNNIAEAIEKGYMTEADLDLALVRIFEGRIRTGEFDPKAMDPYSYLGETHLASEEHADLALEAARKAIVLLKNENHLLPLNKDEISSIAVIGPNANSVQLGGYSGSPPFAISPLQGIADKLGVSIEIPGLKVEAEDYDRAVGVRIEDCEEGTQNVGYIENGDYMLYSKLDFTNKIGIDVRIASQTGQGTLEVRLDSLDGPLLASFDVVNTGGWQNWKTFSQAFEQVEGVHDLYLKSVGGSGYTFNINWFRLTEPETEAKPSDKRINYVLDDIEQAVAAARDSDVAIIVAGTNLGDADEGNDRSSLELPGNQNALVEAVFAANPNTIVVLVHNCSLAINWIEEHVPAVLSAWYNGQSQGEAIADVLFGDYNPGGRLTTTWYQSAEDLLPIGDYSIKDGLGRTYQYFKGDVLYPFGYGLSYTDFIYSNLVIENKNLTPYGELTISFDVKNIGDVAGEEVPQLYVHDVEASVDRPIKELKAFTRIYLEPGETKTITFTLPYDALSFWDVDNARWVVENGFFDIMIGASSEDIRLSDQIMVSGNYVPELKHVSLRTDKLIYQVGEEITLFINGAMTDDSIVDLSTSKIEYTVSEPSVLKNDGSGSISAQNPGLSMISIDVTVDNKTVSASAPVVVIAN